MCIYKLFMNCGEFFPFYFLHVWFNFYDLYQRLWFSKKSSCHYVGSLSETQECGFIDRLTCGRVIFNGIHSLVSSRELKLRLYSPATDGIKEGFILVWGLDSGISVSCSLSTRVDLALCMVLCCRYLVGEALIEEAVNLIEMTQSWIGAIFGMEEDGPLSSSLVA